MTPAGKVLFRVTHGAEIMVTMPSGKIFFMGFFKAIGFLWDLARNGYEVEMDND